MIFQSKTVNRQRKQYGTTVITVLVILCTLLSVSSKVHAEINSKEDVWNEASKAVSYTHLDVYKRQFLHRYASDCGIAYLCSSGYLLPIDSYGLSLIHI